MIPTDSRVPPMGHWVYPTFVPCGIGDVFLDRADGHSAVTGLFNNTVAFAERSYGQMQPQISGKVFVACEVAPTSSSRPVAVRRSQSGMLLCKGQCDWQYGTPLAAPARCSSALAAANSA